MPESKKLALKLRIQTYKILTKNYEVCIPSLSSILLAVQVTDLYFCQLSQKVLIDETLQYSPVSQYF